MNDFEKMCKKLKANKKICLNNWCSGDNYLCAKYAVMEYISKGNKKNRLLSLKAECTGKVILEQKALFVSVISMAVCSLTLILTVVKDIMGRNAPEYMLYMFVSLIFILIISIMYLYLSKKYSAIEIWKPYVLIAIEEIEKEMDAENR